MFVLFFIIFYFRLGFGFETKVYGYQNPTAFLLAVAVLPTIVYTKQYCTVLDNRYSHSLLIICYFSKYCILLYL